MPEDTLERGSFADDKPAKLLLVATPDASELLASARAEAEAWGATHETALVPSPLALAPALASAARLGDFQGFVALSAAPEDAATREALHALSLLALQGQPVGIALLGADGAGAAATALHLIRLARTWQRPEKGLGFLRDRLGAAGGAAE